MIQPLMASLGAEQFEIDDLSVHSLRLTDKKQHVHSLTIYLSVNHQHYAAVSAALT
jgi:hypothetical protein